MITLPPDESFGHVIRNLNRLLQRELAQKIGRHGVGIGQWYVLRVLWIQDGLTQSEIAQRAGIAAPSVAITLRSLAAEQLIVREGHPTDQRKNVVFLTKKGRQLESPCLEAAASVNAAALSGMSQQDLAHMMALLVSAQSRLMSGDPTEAE
ncbi:MarR family winged helix-turn-helix transcriptional regulator [Salipiger abyssi]|uniref:MarR family winged helix-turn-helix transcriptional regulator n=1 Tax=Salipiger abyssi TaxID=1250539 RepID=UPI001A8DEC44|nr:MarR family winged helix-turn-helix transcriptional regulator [Salipiger abyssi]MBN9887106.1 winged helix-turn-helix transcriptional regulator [Salipiger abyssi]